MPEQITYQEIIDLDGLSANVTKVQSELIGMFQKLRDEVTGLNPSLKDQQDRLAGVGIEVDKLKNSQKQLTVAQAEISKQRQLETQLIKDQAAVNATLEGSYANLQAQMKLTADQMKQGVIAWDDGKDKVNELNNKLKDLDATIGNHQRNVGDYKNQLAGLSPEFDKASGTASKFMGVIKGIGSVGTLLGLGVAAAIASVKTFFSDTQAGLEMSKRITAEWSAQWDVVKGKLAVVGGGIASAFHFITDAIFSQNAEMTANKAVGDMLADMQIKLAKAESDSIIPLQKARTELVLAREAYIDQNLTIDEKKKKIQEALDLDTKAEKIEHDLSDQRIAFLKLELAEKKLNGLETVAMQTEINKEEAADYQITQDHSKMRKKDEVELIKLQEEEKKKVDELAKQSADNLKGMVDAFKKADSEIKASTGVGNSESSEQHSKDLDNASKAWTKDHIWFMGMWISKIDLEKWKLDNKDAQKDNKDAIAEEESEWDEAMRRKEKRDKDAEAREKKAKNQALQEGLNFLNSYSAFTKVKEDQELAAAGNNEQKKLEIQKKYSQQRKLIAYGEAIIDGAKAVVKALDNPVPWNFILSALVGAQVAIQLATIQKQQFAKGGYGLLDFEGGVLPGRSHAQGGVDLGEIGEGEQGEYFGIISREMTGRYKDVLPDIFRSLNSGNFEDIWGKTYQRIAPVIIENRNDEILLGIKEAINTRPVFIPKGRFEVRTEGGKTIYREL